MIRSNEPLAEREAKPYPSSPALRLKQSPAMPARQFYERLVDSGKIERDPAQEALLESFSQLEARLAEHRLARKSSSLGWLFGAHAKNEAPLKGLYIFGDVGRGKTMLMDLFFLASPIARKRRVHFHEFMGDVHARVRDFRHKLKRGEIGSRRRPSPRKPGCCASMSFMSPILPMP
jgi:predicted ATPase